MKIAVLFFGITSDLMNTSQLEYNFDEGLSVNDFKNQLQSDYPQLKNLNSYAVALNESYTTGEELIQPNDVLAVIPPVSGG